MATSGLIYLDYNATTPLAPEVKAAITASMELFGNPSSGHALGVASKQAFEAARASVARLVGAKSPEEVVLLSCGTESINYCLRGAMHAARDVWGGDHLVISAVEHDAVLATARHLEQAHGFALTVVPVDEFGLVTPAAVAAAVTPKTVLVSIMHSNNEVGTINDIAGIAAALRAARPGPKAAAFLASLDGGAGGGGGGGGGAGAGAVGDAPPPILLHSDASQSLGKVAVDATALGVDYLTVTGHKLYGPKGIGALYVKASSAVSPNGGGSGAATLPLRKLIHGAGHEGGRRAGTESTLLAAGLGAAADLAVAALAADAVAEAAAATAGATAEEGGAGPAPSVGLAVCRDRLEKRLLEGLGPDRVRVNGLASRRLPNTLSVSFRGLLAPELLARVGGRVAASAGAACHTHDGTSVSHVLAAMKVPLEWARGTVRLSVGRDTTTCEVDEAAELLIAAANALAAEQAAVSDVK